MKNITASLVFLIASAAVAGPMGYDSKNPKAPVLPPPAPIPEPSCRISYDFLEAGYNHVMPDEGSTGQGYYLGFNKSINENFYGWGHGGQTFNTGWDQVDVAGGLGVHVPVGRCFDWVTKVGCLYVNGEGESNWGVVGGTGFRFSVASWLEINTFYHFSNTFADPTDWREHSGSAALIFKEVLMPRVDTVLAGVYADSGTGVSLGLRYNF